MPGKKLKFVVGSMPGEITAKLFLLIEKAGERHLSRKDMSILNRDSDRLKQSLPLFLNGRCPYLK